MKGQTQFPFSPMSILPQINSSLIRIVTCFVIFGLGIAFGTIYSSNIKTVPFFSSQTIQASPPSFRRSNPTAPLQNSQEFIKPEVSEIAQSEESQNLQETFVEQERTQNVRKEIEKPENGHEEVLESQQQNSNQEVIETQQQNLQQEVIEPQLQNLQQEVIEPQQQNLQQEVTEPRLQIEQIEKDERLIHGMGDKELLGRALETSRMEGGSINGLTPKIAFMFLARGELPFMPLWENLFRGHEGKFSIYLHLSPYYNGSEPKNSVFYGRRIPSKIVGWGKVNMMEAERRLLASALLDPSNQRFVLLSESCVPLFNFPTIYSYLTNSKLSYIELYDDPGSTGRGRYKKSMNPPIDITQWRKGSQWFEIDRFLALEIISDAVYFPVFKKYCKGSCYTDEHYLPTLVNIKYGERNANRSLTWVDWSVKGAHPARYYRQLVTPEFLKELREGSRCDYNGEVTSTCYLFGRKFLPNSLIRFLHFSPSVMGFG